MDPVTISLIVGALIRYGPSLAREIQLLFTKKEVTQEDWDKVFSLAEKSYDSYVAPIVPPVVLPPV